MVKAVRSNAVNCKVRVRVRVRAMGKE